MTKPYTLEIYQAKDGWRWRIKAGNNKIVADSAEAYKTKRGVERAVDAFEFGIIYLRIKRV